MLQGSRLAVALLALWVVDAALPPGDDELRLRRIAPVRWLLFRSWRRYFRYEIVRARVMDIAACLRAYASALFIAPRRYQNRPWILRQPSCTQRTRTASFPSASGSPCRPPATRKPTPPTPPCCARCRLACAAASPPCCSTCPCCATSWHGRAWRRRPGTPSAACWRAASRLCSSQEVLLKCVPALWISRPLCAC